MRTIAALAGVCVAVGAACAIQIEKPTQPETPRVPSGGLDTPWLKEERVQLGINNVLDDFHEAAAKADFEKYFGTGPKPQSSSAPMRPSDGLEMSSRSSRGRTLKRERGGSTCLVIAR
jgi:hypothetical protein